MFHENGNKHKKAGVAILMLDKIYFKTKAITGDKEGFSYLTSEYLSEAT